MTQSKEVATKNTFSFGDKETLPAHLAQGTGLGNEDVSSSDLAIPKLNLLQKMSPQVDTLEDAKPGMFLLTTGNQLFGEVYVINLKYRKSFNIFKKRTLGGGYFGSYPSLEAARAELETLDGSPDDYDVQATGQHIVLVLDENAAPITPAIVYMSGTKMEVSDNWNSDIMVRNNGADRFAGVYKLSSEMQSNNKGSWYNMRFQFAGWCDEALYAAAKDAYEGLLNEPDREAA